VGSVTETLYKVLAADGSACNGGSGQWHLPKGKRPGKWMPKLTGIVPCRIGYHLCREDDLLSWLGPRIFVAEGRGERIDDLDKVVVAQARLIRETAWDARAARLFAADCAERAIPTYIEWNCADEPWMDMDRCRDESVSGKERRAMTEAARKAAESARGTGDGDCAADAACAARAAWAAEAPRIDLCALSAIRAAGAARAACAGAANTGAAAGAALSGAAIRYWRAEREWQTKRLLEYLRGER
jgi:hypothetical protein